VADEPALRYLDNGTYLLRFEEIGSTQTELRRRVEASEKGLVAVGANHQTDGYGRRGSPWEAQPGHALLVSYLIAPFPDRPEAQVLFGLAAGAAVAAALVELTELPVGLRWPNDIMLRGRKLGGLIVESFVVSAKCDRPRRVAALGIGINVDGSPTSGELAQTSTSLRDHIPKPPTPDEVEMAVRIAIRPPKSPLCAAEPKNIVERWRSFDATTGLRYQFSDGQSVRIGIAVGVAESGAIILQTDDGRLVEATSATHVR